MSYSYIKNVFPQFETAKVFDDRVYNSLDSAIKPTNTSATARPPLAFDEHEFSRFAKGLLDDERSNFVLPQSKLETFSQSPPTGKDNLRYYNLEAPKEYNKAYTESPMLREGFQGTGQIPKSDRCDVDCDSHTKHVLSCTRCRNMIIKQLSLENDRIRNEEFMEVFSYMIFGVFMLLLIDNLRK
jgi:hypothetical protein